MKAVKTFLIADLIILLIKILGGILCKSNALLASAIYEILIFLVGLFLYRAKDNKKYKGIISALFGLLFIILSIGIVFYSIINPLKKPSWFLIIFIIISLAIRYMVSTYYTNINYQKKIGLLNLAKINSNVDFSLSVIVFLSLILVKLSKWIKILKYGDILGTIVIACLIVYKGIKIIYNSFKFLEDKNDIDESSYITEIEKRDEVKKT